MLFYVGQTVTGYQLVARFGFALDGRAVGRWCGLGQNVTTVQHESFDDDAIDQDENQKGNPKESCHGGEKVRLLPRRIGFGYAHGNQGAIDVQSLHQFRAQQDGRCGHQGDGPETKDGHHGPLNGALVVGFQWLANGVILHGMEWTSKHYVSHWFTMLCSAHPV